MDKLTGNLSVHDTGIKLFEYSGIMEIKEQQPPDLQLSIYCKMSPYSLVVVVLAEFFLQVQNYFQLVSSQELFV